MATSEYIVDGKRVRKFLFGYWVHVAQSWKLVEVEAFNKDHALERLEKAYAWVTRTDWEYIDELDFSHFVGRLGDSLPFNPYGSSERRQ